MKKLKIKPLIIKHLFARFSTKKDALKCYRLLQKLSEITFLSKSYGIGISENKKNIVWVRE